MRKDIPYRWKCPDCGVLNRAGLDPEHAWGVFQKGEMNRLLCERCPNDSFGIYVGRGLYRMLDEKR